MKVFPIYFLHLYMQPPPLSTSSIRWYICYSESTWTHHYHPKYTVYITVPSWFCIFYRFEQMYNEKCSSLRSHTEYFHWYKHPLISAYSSLPPQILVTTDLFIVSIVVPFLECHRLGIIQYVSISYWLLSLNNMHVSFFTVFS